MLAKAAPPAGASPQPQPPGLRVKISPVRITGRILEWKNSFGWIQPDEPVRHPQAAKRQGRIYLSRSDVEQTLDGVGAAVSFYVYADGSGLGAMECRPAPQYGAVKTPVSSKGAQGPRQRVSAMPMTGVVQGWSGSVGWILPCQTVQHPLFRGKLYVSAADVEPPGELMVGTKVAFSMYVDAQGLGAEQCVPLPASDQPVAPPVKLLQAMPKCAPAAAGPRPVAPPPGAPGPILAPPLSVGVPPVKAEAPLQTPPRPVPKEVPPRWPVAPPSERRPALELPDPLKVEKAVAALQAEPGLASSRVVQDPDLARRLATWMMNVGD